VFRHAYELASEFTVPVVVSQRFHDGSVTCLVGTAVVLNDAGWLLTAAHMLWPLQQHAADRPEIEVFDQEAQRIEAGPGSESGKRKRLGQLTAGRTLIRNCSYSPGPLGQSGGPIFDVDGRVWGIQVRTHHIPLGFDPEVEVGGRQAVEHQFMNVRVGASSQTVVAFLGHIGVSVATTTPGA
jgi:hypothetical protein